MKFRKTYKRKQVAVLLSVFLLVTSVAGCQRVGAVKETGEEKVNVVTTIFPQYDFVRQIAGDNVEVSMLLTVSYTHLDVYKRQVFMDLRDRSGILQIVFEGEEQAELMEKACLLYTSPDNNKPDNNKPGNGNNGGQNNNGNSNQSTTQKPSTGTPNKAVKTGDATPIAGAVSGLLAGGAALLAFLKRRK